ncbi:class I SAM-dependent methyltransferase [Streptomyces sp. NPDC033754]|uniref:class I SAM-dependent methyltransferase n=1 Tax=unclassified Streptomyces TaxID=2593676 RepID=UPI00340676F5
MQEVPDYVLPLERDAESREKIGCPICGSDNQANLYEGVALRGNDLILAMCMNCTHLFINPRPTLDAFKEFYQNDNYFELCANFSKMSLEEKMAQFDDDAFWEERAGHARRLYERHLKDVLSAEDTVFDFGCGDGGWLWGLRELTGCSVDGEEISDVYVDIVQKKLGTPIFAGPIEDTADDIVERYRGQVKVAIVSGSLQHMLDPMQCLRAARDILTDDGLLYVCNWSIFEHFMASYEGGPRRLLGENLSWEHLHYFHETSFRYMVRRAGFEIVDFSLDSEVRAGHMEVVLRKTDVPAEPPTRDEVSAVVMRIDALERATLAGRLRGIGLDHKTYRSAAPLPRQSKD